MKLTDRAIANLKATGKIHKHADGGGLYLHVSPSGGKLWRLFYRFGGKVKLLSFGTSPAVSLKLARERRDEAKALLECRPAPPRLFKRGNDRPRLQSRIPDLVIGAIVFGIVLHGAVTIFKLSK